MKIALLLIALAVPQLAHADMYKCIVDGRPTFSDRPCPGAASEKVEVKPAAPTASPAPRDLTRENEAADKRIRAKLDADLAERQQYRADQERFARKCQGYRDEIARQAAWLNAVSVAVRQSAAAEIGIQKRNLIRDGCDPPK